MADDNLFQPYFDDLKARSARQTATAMALIPDAPEEVAERLRIARAADVPPAAVKAVPEIFRQRVEQAARAKALEKSPRLAEWLRSDPDNAALAKDDVENLSWWESLIRAPALGLIGIEKAVEDSQIGRGFRTGVTGAQQMGVAAATVPLAGSQKVLLDRLDLYERAKGLDPSGDRLAIANALGLDPMSAEATLAHDFVHGDEARRQQHVDRAVRMVTSNKGLMTALQERVLEYQKHMETTQGRVVNFTDIEDVKGFTDWLGFNIAQAVPFLAATMAAGAVAGPAGVVASGYGMGVGDIRAEQITGGQDPFDPKAAGAAMVGAVPYAGLELIGPAARPFRGVSGDVLEQVAEGFFKRLGREVPRDMIEEFINEAGQEIVKDYAVQMGGGDEVVLDNETLLRWFNAGMAGLATGGAISPVSTAMTGADRAVAREEERAARSGETAAQLERIDQMAAASKLRERAPDRFEEAMGKAGLADEHIFVPADAMREYFQARDVAIDDETLRAWGIEPNDFAEKAAAGADIGIPLSVYAARISGTEDAGWFKANATSDPDEMSVAEAAEFNARVADIMQETFEASEAERRADLEARASDVQVEDAMFGQLRAAGRTVDVARAEARIWAAFFRTQAARYGDDALELARRFRVRVDGPDRKGAIPRRRGALDILLNDLRSGRKERTGPSLVDFIIAKGGIRDVGGDIEAMDAPKGLIGETRAQVQERRAQATLPGTTPREGRGLEMDELGRMAAEAGYFPDLMGEVQGGNKDLATDLAARLLDAVREELAGRKLYVEGDGPDATRAALAAELLRRGLDPARMSNDEIAAALEKAPEGAEYGQDGRVRTDSDAFRTWFGDSKVADRAGDPLVVYHATNSDFDRFSKRKGGAFTKEAGGSKEAIIISKLGFWSNERDVAEDMGASATMPLHLSIQNPKHIRLDDLIDLAAEAKSVAKLRAIFDEDGYDGLIVDDNEFGGFSYVAFEPTQIKSVFNRGTWDASDPRILHQERRGSILFPKDGPAAGETVINLFQAADLSTFLHESGHFFLETFAVLAADPDAPQAMRDDMAAIRRYLGAQDGEPFTVEQHETWARSWEAYLMEGKSPSLELADAFARFRAWLVRIYRSLAGLNVRITPEIREVMDRMIATDQEIAAAREDMAMRPLFTEAPAGMGEGDWRTYQRMARRSADQAEDALREKVMAKVRREREAWWREERKQVRAEVERTVNSQPVYRLTEAMANGRWLTEGEPKPVEDMRLDRKALVERFGAGVLAELDRRKLGGKRAIYGDEGMRPEEAADWFGFNSAAAMIEALQNAGKRVDAIEAETDRIMRDRYGDPLTDGSIEEEALAAIHSEQQAMTSVAEARQLAAQMGRSTRGMTLRLYRQRARLMIGRMTVAEATRSASFLQAERRAAKEAERAFAKVARGDATALAAALQAKEQQVLNGLLHDESRRVADEVAKAREKMRSYDKASVRAKLEGGYIEQIDALLDRYDFRKRAPGQVARMESLRDFVDRMIAEGREAELAISDKLMDEAQRVHYSRLSVDDLRGLIDTVANLDHLGRFKRKLIDAKEARDLDEVVEGITAAFDANVKERPQSRFSDRGEQRRDTFRRYLNLVKNTDTMLREIDGWQDLGHTWRALKQKVDEGQARLIERRRDMARSFDAIYGRYTVAEQRDMAVKRARPELGGALASKWDILSIALNTGNEDNYQRLTNPRTRGGFTPEQVAAALATLDARDWGTVQAVWDYIDSFWPEIEAKERRMTGVAPGKVAAKMMVDAPATVTGGYYPIRYDTRFVGRVSEVQQKELADALRGGRFGKAQTRNGHTKERIASVAQPLLLDLSVAHQHVDQVLTDLELGEALAASWKIMQDMRVKDAFYTHGMRADHQALELWAQDTAAGDKVTADGMWRYVRHLRAGFVISRLALNVKTALLQPTGLTQSAVVVGKKAMAQGTLAYLRNPQRWVDEVKAVSPFMRERSTTFERDIQMVTGELEAGPVTGRWDKFQRDVAMPWAMAMMQKAQFLATDMPTWVAAYQKELAASGDEGKARDYADAMVKRAQGSGLMSDRAMIERGTLGPTSRQHEVAKLFTALASYFFAKANVAYERSLQTNFRSPAQIMSWVGDMALLFSFEALVTALITGYGPDDDEDWARWLLTETGMSIMSGLPGLREVGGAISGMGEGGIMGAIAKRAFADPIKQVGQGEFDRPLVTALVDAAGVWLHLPSAATNSVLRQVFDEDMGLNRDIDPLKAVGIGAGADRTGRQSLMEWIMSD